MKLKLIAQLTLSLACSVPYWSFSAPAPANSPMSWTMKSGQVRFTAIGKPGFLKIVGESKDSYPTGQISISNKKGSGEFSLDLKALDTGISLRNDHMKNNYLHVDKFPKATLKIANLEVTDPELKSDQKGLFEGKLFLHGVEKPVKGTYEVLAKTKTLSAEFEILVSDFSIDVPRYMGITVSEKVEIKAEAQLAKN